MTPAGKTKRRADDRQELDEHFLMPAGLRRRIDAARAADALEFEQATLRVIIYPGVYFYFLAAFLWNGSVESGELVFLRLFTSVLPVMFLPLAWILLRPGVNVLRRCLGILLDVAAVTLGLLSGGTGAVIYGIYLWITIGNGFRFGLRYLYLAQLLALAGFAGVLIASPFWRAHLPIGAALFLVLAAIPSYVGVLVARFHAASRRLQEARGEAEAANVAKSKFLAAASHDLRQPMQALSMYASVLAQRAADPDAQRVVHGIQLSVITLEQMFDSLLDIVRIESGVIQPGVVAFPLHPLMERVVNAEMPLAAQKGLSLRVVRTAASVKSDPVLLERMLKNLVTNAIRYTERGGIVVGCRRTGGNRARLEIVDSGVGIDSQDQERIFDEYYQLGGRSAQGLGLGLSIVKSLGDLLGHAVAVRSAPGRGSAFSIELERAAVAPEPAIAAVRAVEQALGGATVVVVDDDDEIRRSMRLLLESWGCRFVGGASAAQAEAETHAAGAVPVALIVDYRLAGAADGLQAIARLRAAFGAALPALLITGTPAASLLEEARAYCVSMAVKPVPPGKIRAFLEQAARGKQG
jgi:signal transduction histidine kinase